MGFFLDNYIVLPIKCRHISVTLCAEQLFRRINAIFAILEYDCILTATDLLPCFTSVCFLDCNDVCFNKTM